MLDGWKRRWAARARRRAERRFKQGVLVRGKYQLMMPLGEGSFGVAYLCRDLQHGGRLCVLKRVQPMRGGRRRARAVYGLEVQALASLQHRAIPKLYEAFTYRGYYCFTMEFASGTSLEELLFERKSVFTEEGALSVVRKLLDIIAYVHTQGFVHRDIRIANVLIDGDHIRLIDFGLACNYPEEDAPSPESRLVNDVNSEDPMEKQIRRKIHPTSDFYAVGHLLLFLLYSSYPESESKEDNRSWEDELTGLHPITRSLLRRLLLAEQPYECVQDVQTDVSAALLHFT